MTAGSRISLPFASVTLTRLRTVRNPVTSDHGRTRVPIMPRTRSDSWSTSTPARRPHQTIAAGISRIGTSNQLLGGQRRGAEERHERGERYGDVVADLRGHRWIVAASGACSSAGAAPGSCRTAQQDWSAKPRGAILARVPVSREVHRDVRGLAGRRYGQGAVHCPQHDGRATWSVSGPQFIMNAIYSVAIDKRGSAPRILVGAQSEHWGPSVFHSDDLGETWQEPEHGALKFPADTETSLERVWQLQPGPADQPDVVWAGVEPSALFKSTDGGEHFELVRPLWDHPHRKEWTPGFGGMAIHSVLPHPRRPEPGRGGDVHRRCLPHRGRRRELGRRPTPASRRTSCRTSTPSTGSASTRSPATPTVPEQFFLQNHHGVYRSDDGARDLDFHRRRPSRPTSASRWSPTRTGPAWRTTSRSPPTASGSRPRRGRVYRTEDEGKSWTGCPTACPSASTAPSCATRCA